MDILFFETPAAFRAWLEQHHESAQELWVGFHKKGSGKPSITWPESVDEALCFGWIDGVRKSIDETSYKIRFTPRKPRSTWSTVNMGRVEELARLGRMHPAGLKAFEERTAGNSGIYAHEQRQEAELGEDFEREFRANEPAWAFFQTQPAWYRRAATWWVISAKKDETRRKRLATLIADSAGGRRIKELNRSGGGRPSTMNQQTRMILVEGVPFTGKSTTSEYIATQLELNGYRAHWISEGMLLQRYFPYVSAVLDRRETLSETTLRTEWRTFVETALAAATIFVVDSALSYAAVDPLLNEDRPVEAIQAELRHIAELCAPLQPRVIHLTGDAERLVPASIVERGEGWREHLVGQAEATPYQQARNRSGVAGVTRLLHDSQALLGAVLARDNWPALTLDVTAPDWAAHRRAILAFLELNEVPLDRPVLARSVLQSYTGTYAAEDPERSDKMLSVRLEHDSLALYGATMRYGPLVPVSATRFHLQATPVDIEFVVEQDLAQHLILHTSDGKMHGYRRA